MNNAKRITIVVPKAYAYFSQQKNKKVGGAEIQVIYLGREFIKKGFAVDYLCSDFGQNTTEAHDKLMFHNVFSYDENRFVAFFNIMRFLLLNKSKTLLFRSASSQTAIIMLFAKFLLRKRLIYMIASDIEVTTSWRSNFNFPSFLMNSARRFCDLLTVQSEFQYNHIKSTNNKAVIIPNLLPSIQKSNTAKEHVCWVGKSVKMKNAELFFDLATQNPEIKFVMVISKIKEPDPYWQQLKNRAKQIENLDFKGQLEHNNVLKVYNQSWAYVLTSDYEGFSNSMMEAMRANCVIYSLTVNPDEIITHYNLGYVANSNRTDFLSKFKEIAKDRERCIEMGENAKRYIQNFHSPKAIPSDFWKKINTLTS